VEDSRRRCALVIGLRVMWERELGHSELRRVCPQPLSTFCIRAVRQGPTTISWLAPPIRARDQTGLRLGLIPLDARWGQSNTDLSLLYCALQCPVRIYSWSCIVREKKGEKEKEKRTTVSVSFLATCSLFMSAKIV
jgi:hypothetical protein